MAQNDPYLPDYATVAASGSTTFDGSDSSTNQAIINEISGNFDATLYIEESNDGGSTWTQITQLSDANGNNTFGASWHTQYNRIYVASGERRLRVDDEGSGGEVSVTGDER